MFSGAGIILGRFGSEVIAANGIAMTIGGLFFMIPYLLEMQLQLELEIMSAPMT